MATGHNRVVLIGRLGNPGKRFTTKNQKSLSSFRLAVNSSRLIAGKWLERTDWINCVVFFPNLIERVTDPTSKGRLMFIEGRIQVTDMAGPTRKTYWSIVVEKLQFLDTKATLAAQQRADREPGADEPVEMDEGEPVSDEEVPF